MHAASSPVLEGAAGGLGIAGGEGVVGAEVVRDQGCGCEEGEWGEAGEAGKDLGPAQASAGP